MTMYNLVALCPYLWYQIWNQISSTFPKPKKEKKKKRGILE